MEVSKLVTVAWECWACGERHEWDWDLDDVEANVSSMQCDCCGRETFGRLVHIGVDAYALAWRY